MELDVLTEAIDRLVGTDPSGCAGAESVVELQRQLARLEAFATRAVAAFDTSGGWVPDGAYSASAWIATRCRLPQRHARRLVRRARHLSDLPACERAWSEGEITAAHVDAVASVRTDRTAEALSRDEAFLVGQATELRFSHFNQALRYWGQLADPDGTESSEERRRDRRDAYLVAGFGGLWVGRLTLDPISGAIVAGELGRIEQELFEADRAEATERLGREPTPSELSRTPGQRRADALVEMATRSKACPKGARRPAPLFSVLVDYETLSGRICELADGTVLSPGSLLRWLERADIERAVFGPDGRVEVGATARFFTGATRRALELSDRECAHPYCERRAEACQADHVHEYSKGGPTIQDNGRILCGFHNRLRNQRPPPDEAR